MKFEVDPWNNFCRVFKLPKQYPRGFCFSGGKHVSMLMEDWFCPVSEVCQAAVSKEVWAREVGPVEEQVKEVDGDELIKKLTEFLQKKDYVEAGQTYLVVCDFGLACTFERV